MHCMSMGSARMTSSGGGGAHDYSRGVHKQNFQKRPNLVYTLRTFASCTSTVSTLTAFDVITFKFQGGLQVHILAHPCTPPSPAGAHVHEQTTLLTATQRPESFADVLYSLAGRAVYNPSLVATTTMSLSSGAMLITLPGGVLAIVLRYFGFVL